MRVLLFAIACLATFNVIYVPERALAQTDAGQSPRVATAPVVPSPPNPDAVETPPKPLTFTYMLFWRDSNVKVQQMEATLKAVSTRRQGQMEWSSVNVNDPTNQLLVERYQVSRAPMPLVLCVASNGAITGAFTSQLSEAAVERAIITPAMADVTKALQDKKIVLLHVKANAESQLPQGATDFAADPNFQARTTIIHFVATDPVEARFMTDMKLIASDVRDSRLVVMAPPAVLVGKFAANTTKDQIAAQLHAAGKCCDDPNCKHNKGAQQ